MHHEATQTAATADAPMGYTPATDTWRMLDEGDTLREGEEARVFADFTDAMYREIGQQAAQDAARTRMYTAAREGKDAVMVAALEWLFEAAPDLPKDTPFGMAVDILEEIGVDMNEVCLIADGVDRHGQVWA